MGVLKFSEIQKLTQMLFMFMRFEMNPQKIKASFSLLVLGKTDVPLFYMGL